MLKIKQLELKDKVVDKVEELKEDAEGKATELKDKSYWWGRRTLNKLK